MMRDFEHIRNLSEMDLQDRVIVHEVVQDLREARAREFVSESILDILDED